MRILSAEQDYTERAMELADRLGAEICSRTDEICGDERYLLLDGKGLALIQGKMELRGDFRNMIKRVLGGRLQHEKLLRAVRFREDVHGMLAVDATAGLGEDSFILAAAGFSVLMCEYNPVIAALLRDALDRARTDPDIGEIARRMELREGSSIDILGSLGWKPDVIYLDPMFPARTKSSLVKKKFQLLQQLEPPCSDSDALLEAAIKARPHKIIIKRPAKGPYLADIKPDYSLSGKAIRYDCILPDTRKF
jgi:16S rRNA (guanine1516-N2)-methyltransferase